MDTQFLKHWLNGFDRSLADLDGENREKLLQACGEACSNSYSRNVYMRAYDLSNDIDSFIEHLNEAFEELDIRRVRDDEIELIYTRCACPLVKAGFVEDALFCICSLKSLKYNWESVLGKENVDIRLKESILAGDEKCLFTVKLLK